MNFLAETEIIAEIAAFAAIAHNGQRRRGAGNIPYIVHPARVAALVTRFGGDWRAIAVAWLHDVIEDCPAYNDVTKFVEFVDSLAISDVDKQLITMMVIALTKDPTIESRKERLIEHIKMIENAPQQAVLVKLCDRIDNLVMNRYEIVEDKIDGMEFSIFLEMYLEETRILLDGLRAAAAQCGYYDVWDILNEQVENNGKKLMVRGIYDAV
jgi:guanosine-3',5'-bis(diphosphate) 3'-pyrophosphohydrolase